MRPSSDRTLGGMKKREFLPVVPNMPFVKKEREPTDPSKPKMRDFPPTERKQRRDNRVPPTGRGRGRGRGRGSSTPVGPFSSPFASGPPAGGGVSFDNDSFSDVKLDTGELKEQKKPFEMDPMDPTTPQVVPFRDPTDFVKQEKNSFPLKENEMCLIQFPSHLQVAPLPKEEKKKKKSAEVTSDSDFENVLRRLPEGEMGKLRVYRSGRTELVVGSTVYHFQQGAQSTFYQQVVTLGDGQCLEMGQLSQRFICTPSLDSLLQSSS